MSGASRRFVAHSLDVVHSWAMFRLVRRKTIAPSGEQFERTFVSTPGAVGCVAITADNDIVLVRQYRSTFDDLILEIPAGMRDIEGEDPELTAVRELREETGYSANKITYLGRMLSSPGVTDSAVEVYLATELVPGEAEPHGPEEDAMEIVVIPFSEAVAMVEDGRLGDSKSVFGVLLAARRYGHLYGVDVVK